MKLQQCEVKHNSAFLVKHQHRITQRNLEDHRLEKSIPVTWVLNVVHKPLNIHSLASPGHLFSFWKMNADHANPVEYS